MWFSSSKLSTRLKELEQHLRNENPLLVSVVRSFHKLDKVGYATGLLDQGESYANQISWWPLISILGTFSAGKSTFINYYVGENLQETGNQAVDDKFTVICFSEEGESRVLPGIALDSDPRFPFYQISNNIEAVSPGEGQKIDSYLQLKTCPSEIMRGKILIDSPGFDADDQRQAILRSTEHIINLSDLILVFFDARHPEPGAMRETLKHLVSETIERQDSSKFLFILNQMDTSAREDNPEEVVASWQRALAQEGLTAGKFYMIFNPDVAVPIENDELRKRYEEKRDKDLGAIKERMANVSVERSYRIISLLDKTVKELEQDWMPRLRECVKRWRTRVLWVDVLVFSLLLSLFIGGTVSLDYWNDFSFEPPWLVNIQDIRWKYLMVAVGLLFIVYLHHMSRRIAANIVIRWIGKKFGSDEGSNRLVKAFLKNTRPWRSIFAADPVGWGRRTSKITKEVIDEADKFVQVLNDQFTNPSGDSKKSEP